MARPRAGFTITELLLGLLIVGSLSLVLVQLFRVTLLSSRTATARAAVLDNTRKALHGDGPAPGLVFDSERSAALTSLTTNALSLTDSALAVTTYTVAAGDLRAAKAGVTVTRAKGLSGLSFTYYALDSNYTLYEATEPGSARFVAVSFSMTGSTPTPTFFSGAALENFE